ncbi:SDR family NAD(P)-dependent oxidoreductase [Mariniluteicoccus flavus]
MKPFKPQVSIVTGGASGIGRALATRLAERGGRVIIADRDIAAAERTATELGERVTAVALDVADSDAVRALVVETTEAEGRLDLIANNAGILPTARSRSSTSITGGARST